MCLGLPGEILSVTEDEDTGLPMALVRFGPVTQTVCLGLVSAAPGEFVIAHAGFAIARLDEEAAQKTLGLLDQIQS